MRDANHPVPFIHHLISRALRRPGALLEPILKDNVNLFRTSVKYS